MTLKPRQPDDPVPGAEDEIDILIEAVGDAEMEAVDILISLEAKQVERLADGFLSARIKRRQLGEVEAVGRVKVKTTYQMKKEPGSSE